MSRLINPLLEDFKFVKNKNNLYMYKHQFQQVKASLGLCMTIFQDISARKDVTVKNVQCDSPTGVSLFEKD